MARNARSGGRILVDQLLIHGAERVFCVPGESFLAALDAMHDEAARLQLVTCRHEATACQMAEAHGKLRGRPGICFVTRGPGASHAMVGVHTAFQDSTPLILFVGQVARGTREREAFQEIDVKSFFGATAKWAAEIDDPRRIPEFLARACQQATSGRPGPVVLGLPEDMLEEEASVEDGARYQLVRPSPAPEAMAKLSAILASAKRPVLMLGGGGWSEQAVADIGAFAEANALPVAASFRCLDLYDNRRPNYAGDCGAGIAPALARRIREECDVLLVVGAMLGEFSTQGYTLVVPPRPRQRLVHVHAGAGELGRVYQGELLINSGMEEFAAAARALRPVDAPWRDWTQAARAEYEANLVPGPCPGALDLGVAMRRFSEKFPREGVVTIDSGNFGGWVQRFHQVSRFRAFLGSANGCMGYAVPAAIAAKLAEPKRPVVAFTGDGGFLMSGHELGTAVQHGAAVVVVVIVNGMYGTIKMHQALHYPGRYPATEFSNPDFAAYARAFGALGESVRATDEFVPAIERALASGKPAVVEAFLDPAAITTRASLGDLLRAAGKKSG